MNRWPMRVLISGIVITIGAPLVGSIGTMLGMIRSFNTLGANGISDPKSLAGDIGTSLVSTMCGLVASATIGLPLIIVGAMLLTASRKKPGAPTVS